MTDQAPGEPQHVAQPALNYARRRIREYEALGKLRPDQLEPEKAITSAVLAALKQEDAAPNGALYLWLHKQRPNDKPDSAERNFGLLNA